MYPLGPATYHGTNSFRGGDSRDMPTTRALDLQSAFEERPRRASVSAQSFRRPFAVACRSDPNASKDKGKRKKATHQLCNKIVGSIKQTASSGAIQQYLRFRVPNGTMAVHLVVLFGRMAQCCAALHRQKERFQTAQRSFLSELNPWIQVQW